MDKPTISLLRKQCYIDGAWVGEPALSVTNPATGAEIAKVPLMSAKQTQDAITAAERAFPAWSKMLAKDRSKILRNWFDLMIEHADELALLMTMEQGKPLAEAKGEVVYAASFIEFFAEEAKRINGETIPTFKDGARVICIKQPIGVVAAISPWNFPAAMITRKAGPALAVGCTMVVKPASETPLTALALAELGERAGIPKGVFNVITGKASVIGKCTTRHCLTTSNVKLSQYMRSSTSRGVSPWLRMSRLVSSRRRRDRCKRNLPVRPLPMLISMAHTASHPRMALKCMPACTSTRSDPAQAMRSCKRSNVAGLPRLTSLRL